MPLINAEIVKPEHPVFYGYTERNAIMNWNDMGADAAPGPRVTAPASGR